MMLPAPRRHSNAHSLELPALRVHQQLAQSAASQSCPMIRRSCDSRVPRQSIIPVAMACRYHGGSVERDGDQDHQAKDVERSRGLKDRMNPRRRGFVMLGAAAMAAPLHSFARKLARIGFLG